MARDGSETEAMPLSRKFLDWQRPALDAVVDDLLATYGDHQTLDLDRVVLVVPGKRAGRHLLERLVQRCDESGLVFVPPQITTVGRLPELLYESKRVHATDLVQQLGWIHALRSMGRRSISKVIPQLPADDDVVRWLELGKLLWRQHRELAGDGLDFRDVIRRGAQTEGFDQREKKRWQFLRRVQEKYLEILDEFELWDQQTARLYAIEHRECRTDRQIVMVATADANRALRQMLDQVEANVCSLVHAPRSIASRFDEYGCIRPDAWQDLPIEPDRSQIHIVDGPADQAAKVAQCIAQYNGRYRADEIAIGVPDESLVPHLRRQLQQCGVDTRWVVGRKLAEMGPYRLLSLLANFCERGRMNDFASLVRHPDVSRWLDNKVRPKQLIRELDEYIRNHLPTRPGNWLGPDQASSEISVAHEEIEQLMQPWQHDAQKLGPWASEIGNTLAKVYANLQLDRSNPNDHYQALAFVEIRRALEQHNAVPDLLAPKISASGATRLLLDQLASVALPPPPDEQAIELLGWLELPLGDTPALVVTSMNEEFVPKSMNSDLFLPNNLRRELGLVDNTRRYARDAYAFSALLASRQELDLVSSRRDRLDNALTPSRLLFSAQPEETARRAKEWFGPLKEAGPLFASTLQPGCDEYSNFVVPPPAPLTEPITSLRVTAFRDYLSCPYRFYLRHVLKLDGIDDRVDEMDAAIFGTVIHEVLNDFGRNEIRECSDAFEIEAWLFKALDRFARRQFGPDKMPAVTVQLMQMRHRLTAFAHWQAGWYQQGWRVRASEAPGSKLDKPIMLDLPGQSIELRGRIDRVDQNHKTGHWMLIDYKTSDSARTPEQVHQRAGDWVDLQLPLYLQFQEALGIDGPVQLAYLLLPKDLQEVGLQVAGWSQGDLKQAERKAIEVAQDIVAEKFWPPSDHWRTNIREFAAICQDGVRDRVLPQWEGAA